MRLNVYAIDYHTRPEDSEETGQPGKPSGSSRELVAAENLDVAIAVLRGEVDGNMEVEHVGNGPQNVLIVLPKRKPSVAPVVVPVPENTVPEKQAPKKVN